MPESNPEPSRYERSPPWRRVFTGFALIALYQLLLGLWHERGYDLRSGILICIAAVQIGLPILLLRSNGAPVRGTLRIHPLPVAEVFWILVMAAALVLPVEWLAQWNTRWVAVPEWSLELQEQLRPHSMRDWILSGMALCVFAPIGEELIFRGLMQQAVRPSVGGAMGAVVIGLVFALMHFTPWYFLGLALLGIAMGLCFERTGSLLAPIALHAAYNLASLSMLGTDDLTSLQIAMPALGIAAVLSAGIAYVAYGRLRRLRPWPEEEFSDATGTDPDPG